jgi:hypothetical protein
MTPPPNCHNKYTAINYFSKSLKLIELPLLNLEEFSKIRNRIYFSFKKPNVYGVFAYITEIDIPETFTVYGSSDKLNTFNTKKEILSKFKKDNPNHIMIKAY